jgi:hypothetical protein
MASVRKAVAKYQKTEKGKKVSKNSRIKTKYGLTLEEFEEKAKQQNYQCAICSEVHTTGLCIDHCHETLKVRDLLCTKCNVGLGMFRENPNIFLKALEYIEKHKE